VDDEAGPWASAGPLLGAHNRRNAQIALRALAALGVPGLDDEPALARAFASFVPLPSRLTRVADVDGVTFVDDSISTNVLSATAALSSFPGRRIGLLVGGLERDIDYRPLAAAADRAGVRVFTMPTNGPTISSVLRAEGVAAVVDCACLQDAVRQAYAWARPDGVVLLSPAAASFDLFADYRARGRAFEDAVRQLARSP
jgi:UDP-N-acetylmuramoylalanine--D-glutamate ligase